MTIENLKDFFDITNIPYIIIKNNKIIYKNILYDEIYNNYINSNTYKYNNKYYKLISNNITINNINYIIKYFFDITEYIETISNLKVENKRLKIDNITGLATRNEIEHYTTTIYNDSVIVMCDIDNFKKVNDTYGHSKGDLVLKKLGNLIKKNIYSDKDKNNFACRYGGEEFLIVFETTDVNFIKERIDLLNKQFSDLNIIPSLSFSAGISIFNKEKHIQKAIDEADIALYEAKKTGKNKCVIYTSDMKKQEQKN